MADSDKPDPQALILKQLKSIKITLWAVVVLIVLFTGGGVVVGGVIAGIKAFYFSGGDESTADGGTAHIEWGPEEAAEACPYCGEYFLVSVISRHKLRCHANATSRDTGGGDVEG